MTFEAFEEFLFLSMLYNNQLDRLVKIATLTPEFLKGNLTSVEYLKIMKKLSNSSE